MNIFKMIEDSDFDPGDFNEWGTIVEQIDALITNNTDFKLDDKPEISIIAQKMELTDQKSLLALVVLRAFLLGRYADPVL